MSRMDRVVAEHQQFSQALNELQDWTKDSIHLLQSYCHPTADKSVLDSRMSKLEVTISQAFHLFLSYIHSANIVFHE